MPETAPALDAQALVAQLGAEVAAALSSALERVNALTATGRIDRSGLRALREEVELARRAGIMAQQLVRLGSGQVPLAHERIKLTALLREALLQRGREIEARGIEVRQQLDPAQVRSDATLVFSLLQALLDWSFEHAVSRIDFQLQVQNWPVQAVVSIHFAHQPADEVETGAMPLDGAEPEEERLNTMSWRLLQQTAGALGLPMRRRDHRGKTDLHITFPDTLSPHLLEQEVEAPAEEERPARGAPAQALAGRHVLVMASRREVRGVVRQALLPLGMRVDFVPTLTEARQACAEALPHAVVYEASFGGEPLEALRAELLQEMPTLPFVQIAEQGKAFAVLNLGGRQIASVGRDAVIESLPAALLFELSRGA